MKKTNITFKHIYTNKQTNQKAFEQLVLMQLRKELENKKLDK